MSQCSSEIIDQHSDFLLRSGLLLGGLAGSAFLGLFFGFCTITRSFKETVISLRNAEQQSSLAKKEWERNLDAMPDLVTILDKDLTIVRTNKTLPTMLGISMNEVLGTQCYNIFCGNNTIPGWCPYHRLLKEKNAILCEIYHEKLNYYFEVSLAPLFDDDGKLIGAVHVARNITERKRLEQRLEENHSYLSSILEASQNTAIVATDAGLKINYCNLETERILGLPRDEVLGQYIMDLHHRFGNDTILKLSKAIEQVRENGYFQFTMERGDLFLDAQVTAIKYRDHEFIGMLLTVRDITDQKISEQRLIQSEKLEAIGLMAGGVAHELNNILSGIIGYPDLLLQELPPDSSLRTILSSIKHSGMRAADVVDDLLTFARGVTKHKELHSINDLVHECLYSPELQQLKRYHPKIKINLELYQACFPCLCSPGHIRKIIMNLVINAFDAMGNVGKITITTRNQTSRPKLASDSVSSNRFVVLEINDTGPGMSEKVQKHIFEPFYSTKKLGRSGTGLGLALVWQVVKSHCGLITVVSSSDGTTFTVYLPATSLQDAPEQDVDEKQPENLQGLGTVLIVDDEEMLRNLAGRMLSTFCYTVHTAASGEEAIAWLRKNKADLLVLDMDLGTGINGRETLEQALAIDSGQRALIVSGLANKKEVQRALFIGAHGYLKKPFSLQQIGQEAYRIMNMPE